MDIQVVAATRPHPHYSTRRAAAQVTLTKTATSNACGCASDDPCELHANELLRHLEHVADSAADPASEPLPRGEVRDQTCANSAEVESKLVSALTNMGFRNRESKKAVAALAWRSDTRSQGAEHLAALVRQALAILVRSGFSAARPAPVESLPRAAATALSCCGATQMCRLLSPGWEGNLVGPLLTQLLEICTEAHPGWDNLSGERDAELRRIAPAGGVFSMRFAGAGGGGVAMPVRERWCGLSEPGYRDAFSAAADSSNSFRTSSHCHPFTPHSARRSSG